MPGYEIIIYWSQADEAFIAEVPELPGCAADGETYKEALANVEIIIQEWIGWPILRCSRRVGLSCPFSNFYFLISIF